MDMAQFKAIELLVILGLVGWFFWGQRSRTDSSEKTGDDQGAASQQAERRDDA